MTRTMRRAPGPCASETIFIMQVGGRFVNGPASSLQPRNLDIHQWRVLLAAMVVAIPQITLEVGARDRRLEGQRVITDKKFHLLRGQAIPRCDRFTCERTGIPDTLVDLWRGEHNVKGQLKGTSVLTADKSREFTQSRHDHLPLHNGLLVHLHML